MESDTENQGKKHYASDYYDLNVNRYGVDAEHH